jgi:nucleoid DNA-binding protein
MSVLAQALTELEPDERLYLPEIGWLELKRYEGYTGRNPKTGEVIAVKPKWAPFFMAESVTDRSFMTEEERYFWALHGDAPADEERVKVMRFPWLDEISVEIRRQLETGLPAAVPGVGTFAHRTRKSDGRRSCSFSASDELKERLEAACGLASRSL